MKTGKDQLITKSIKYRLVADMDGTLLPNGKWADNNSLEKLNIAMTKNDISLTILTGRSLRSIHEAMNKYPLPQPELIFACGGGELYRPLYSNNVSEWKLCPEYRKHLDKQNPKWKRQEIVRRLRGIPLLSLQDDIHQSEYKISFELETANYQPVLKKMRERLCMLDLDISIIPYPIVEDNFCFVDIMGRGCDKAGALDWLKPNIETPLIFAGDNYNDKSAFLSKHKSIIVRNTPEDIINEVRQKAPSQFIAKKLTPERSGYYSDGILQGLEHIGWVY